MKRGRGNICLLGLVLSCLVACSSTPRKFDLPPKHSPYVQRWRAFHRHKMRIIKEKQGIYQLGGRDYLQSQRGALILGSGEIVSFSELAGVGRPGSKISRAGKHLKRARSRNALYLGIASSLFVIGVATLSVNLFSESEPDPNQSFFLTRPTLVVGLVSLLAGLLVFSRDQTGSNAMISSARDQIYTFYERDLAKRLALPWPVPRQQSAAPKIQAGEETKEAIAP